MTGLTWLHLSDWHQKGAEFDRLVVRDALIKDIRERAKRINKTLSKVDFVIFSGDLAFSGQENEYQAAKKHLLEQVLEAVELPPSCLFSVPGNHDLNRDHIYDMLPLTLQRPLQNDSLVQTWLTGTKLKRTLEPFEAYRKFMKDYTGEPGTDFACIRQLEVDGVKVGLLGLNSALMCARNKDQNGEVNDDGYLIVGEPQIHDALALLAGADLRIAVLHHPFDWLAQFDRNRVVGRLMKECHFILHGHQHQPQVNVIRSTAGDCVIIPAGSCYERRVAADPRYTNAYNWVHLDFAHGRWMVYLRQWNDQNGEWREDQDASDKGRFPIKPLPKNFNIYNLVTPPLPQLVSQADEYKHFAKATRISPSQKNKKHIEAAFLGWESGTILAWIEILEKGSGIRELSADRYILAHSTGEAPNGRPANLFALLHSRQNKWRVVCSNQAGQALKGSAAIEDNLAAGWHHFMITWRLDEPELTLRIDGGRGGQSRSLKFDTYWPKALADKMTVGASVSGAESASGELRLAKLWIFKGCLLAGDERVGEHMGGRPR